jgi:hypothetical protein
MHEANPKRTTRLALVDDGQDPIVFAKRSVAWAQEHGHDSVVWYFKTRESVRRLEDRSGRLRSVGSALYKQGAYTTQSGLRIVLATKRNMTGEAAGGPVAVWWATDDQLMAIDSTLWPMIDAFVGETWKAPIWLTAFDVDIDAPVGVLDPESGIAGVPSRVVPIIVTDELQAMVSQRIEIMNLVNGVHDSSADQFIAEARAVVRRGDAMPEAVVVAALRCGWWPDNAPDLLNKLAR